MATLSLRPSMVRTLAALVACAALNLSAHAADDAGPAQAEALARAHAAVIGVAATAVEEAASIVTLGRERRGSGVVIDSNGLVLTIGYLILEADHVDLLLAGDRSVPARVLAYDLATGFGLLQALAPLRLAPAPLGRSAALATDEPLMIASGGADGGVSLARLVSKRPFSGYWEYHIDGALFTAPARSDHSGAGLFNAQGELMGVGSLLVGDALGPGRGRAAGNMFVPVDLLAPILAELREHGASRGSTRAWLGLNCAEIDGEVHVLRVTPDSPAERAGLLRGDRILRIDGLAVAGLEAFYKALWRDGAEREVRLEIQRGGETRSLTAQALDRMKTLRRPQGI